MRLVRINQIPEKFGWDVLAIADAEGLCAFWDELKAASISDGAAEKMLGLLERDVPMNGIPKNTRICNPLGDDIYEFKTWGWRVLWFYGTGKQVVCTHHSKKIKKKEFQKEIAKAIRLRGEYMDAKRKGQLVEPKLGTNP